MILLENGIVPDGPSHNDPVGPPGAPAYMGLGSTSDVLENCIQTIMTVVDVLKNLKERNDADARGID